MANSYGTATPLTSNANGLTAGGYASLGVIDFGAAPPHECFVEITATASGTPGGNKQVIVYARSSLDGTNWSDAPSATALRNAMRVGALNLPDTNARRSVAFPLSQLFGGALPPKAEIYVCNDTGVTLTACAGQYRAEMFG